MAWIIKYRNLSSKTVTLSGVGGYLEAVVDVINHQPARTLGPGGSDYLSISETAVLDVIANGEVDFFQGVGLGDDVLWVRIVAPLQVVGIGTSPYWHYYIGKKWERVSVDGSTRTAWSRHDSDTVTTTFNGLQVKMSPVKSHTEITVEVLLEDAA